MNKKNKKSLTFVSVSLGVLFSSHLLYAADSYNNTKKTTTVEQTTTQTTSTSAPRPVKKPAPVVTTTSSTSTITTKPGEPRSVLDEKALKKMSDTLCVKGFKPYVGNDKKNVCQGKANVPDLAYSCIWQEEGNAAFEPSETGPCTLDFVEHVESVIITKNDFASNPPLPYGTEAQCCFRAAESPNTSTLSVTPTTTVVAPR